MLYQAHTYSRYATLSSDETNRSLHPYLGLITITMHSVFSGMQKYRQLHEISIGVASGRENINLRMHSNQRTSTVQIFLDASIIQGTYMMSPLHGR